MSSMSAEQRAEVSRRLAQLEDPVTGRLTPEAVVADAKLFDSPLHNLFDWNVEKAAYQHWLTRAREIMTMRVVVTTDSKSVSVVGYVRDPSAGPSEAGYVSVTRVREDSDASRDVLLAEFARIRDLLNRAKELAEVFGVGADVQGMAKQVAGLRERIIQQPEQRM